MYENLKRGRAVWDIETTFARRDAWRSRSRCRWLNYTEKTLGIKWITLFQTGQIAFKIQGVLGLQAVPDQPLKLITRRIHNWRKKAGRGVPGGVWFGWAGHSVRVAVSRARLVHIEASHLIIFDSSERCFLQKQTNKPVLFEQNSEVSGPRYISKNGCKRNIYPITRLMAYSKSEALLTFGCLENEDLQ